MKTFWGELKKKRLFFLVAGAILICAGIVLQYSSLTSTGISYKPNFLYSATIDNNGNKYIVSDGRAELAKVNSDHTVLWTKKAAKASEFTECVAAVSDFDGNIYAHTMRWSSTGLSLDGEAVSKYSKAGKYEGDVFSLSYNKNTVYKQQLYGLSIFENKLSFVKVTDNSYSIYSCSNGTSAQLLKNGTLKQDIQDIAAFNGSISYTTKSGEVYTKAENETDLLVFKPAKNSFVVPYKLAYSQNGDLYFTDIGNSDIYKADKNGAKLLITRQDMEINFGVSLDNEVLNNISVNGNNCFSVIFDNFFGIINTDTNTFTISREYSYQLFNMVLSIMKQICLSLGAVFLLLSIVMFMHQAVQWFIFAKSRTTILLIGCIAATVALVMPNVLGQVKQSLIDAKKSELSRIAASVAVSLSAQDLQTLNYPSDYNSESGKNIRKMITQMLPRIGSGNETYCNLTKIHNGRAYSFFYQDNSIGVYYPLRQDEAQALKLLYETGETQFIDELAVSTGSFISVSVPIIDNGKVIGAVEVGMVLSTINGQLDAILQSVLTNTALIVIMLIFIIQAIMSFYTDKKELKAMRSSNQKPFPVDSLRLCVLLCAFAYNMPTAFLPVFMEKLYDPSLPFGQYTAGALPLTMNIFLTGVAALICSLVSRKFGIRNSLLSGVACVFVGDFFTATANNYWQAFGGIILNGIGAGFVFAMLFVIIAKAKPEEQGRGFSAYNGALMCGMICGTLAGASLAEKLSQKNVFFCALFMWVLLFTVVFFVGKSFGTVQADVQTVKKQKSFSIKNFLFSPSVFLFILLVQFPFAAADGFSYYFVPVFGAQQGLTEQQVSLLMVLNSLAAVFVGDWLTQFFISKYKNRTMYIAAAMLALAIVLFAVNPTIPTLIVAILIIGIAHSFGQPAQDIHICSLPATQRYGTQRGLGVYNFLQNIGNSTGTSVFGLITELAYTSGVGILAGFGAFAAIGTSMSFLHGIIFSKADKKQKK